MADSKLRLFMARGSIGVLMPLAADAKRKWAPGEDGKMRPSDEQEVSASGVPLWTVLASVMTPGFGGSVSASTAEITVEAESAEAAQAMVAPLFGESPVKAARG